MWDFQANLKKIADQHEQWILELRKTRKLGARRIQTELHRIHRGSFSLAPLHKVLNRNKVKPLKRKFRKINVKRYQRPIPGNRVQLDTRKSGPSLYQYTASLGLLFPLFPYFNIPMFQAVGRDRTPIIENSQLKMKNCPIDFQHNNHKGEK